jgi:hypothetical protein
MKEGRKIEVFPFKDFQWKLSGNKLQIFDYKSSKPLMKISTDTPKNIIVFQKWLNCFWWDSRKPISLGDYQGNLPKEILRLIFNYLNENSLRNASCACKSWYQLSSNNDLWEKFTPNVIPYTVLHLPTKPNFKRQLFVNYYRTKT